jgi:hypothetical protein
MKKKPVKKTKPVNPERKPVPFDEALKRVWGAGKKK